MESVIVLADRSGESVVATTESRERIMRIASRRQRGQFCDED